MLHNGEFSNADDALNFYGRKRTHNDKGVTIPSQRRYVEYYARLLTSGKSYNLVSLQVSICINVICIKRLITFYRTQTCYGLAFVII